MNQDVWVFDIDGVITDPELKSITQPEILNILANRLCSDNKVAFNTGRSAKWLETNVVIPLTDRIKSNQQNTTSLRNLISVCEMGNILVQYDSEGRPRKKILNQNIIPDTLSKALKEIVDTVYSKSMFVDETKEVILTIEMRDGYSKEEFEKRQEEFQKEINIIMKYYHPNLHVKPSSTTIAIDVKPIDSGKKLGASRILELHNSQHIDTDNTKYICFGDSLSDIDMTDYLNEMGIETEFVFVGEDELDDRGYPIHISKSKYSEGTLEYLQTL